MQYDLLTDRGLQPDMDMPLKTLLYIYSKYRKDREEAMNDERIMAAGGKTARGTRRRIQKAY